MRRNARGVLACALGLVAAAALCGVPARASVETQDFASPRRYYEPNEPPVIPVGLDAYRRWDRWPYQRIGARAYMRSTYDRRGGNEGADASHFLYQLGDEFNVSLDVAGPGVLYFARYNHWHGSPWHYIVDGRDNVVQESSSAQPDKPVENSVFLPADVFPTPLAATWSATKGADLSWVPIPFQKTFRMGYSRTCYGTGYYIYHQWVPGVKLSQPLRAWDGKTPPDKDVLELIQRAGTDLLPAPGSPEAQRLRLAEGCGDDRSARQVAVPSPVGLHRHGKGAELRGRELRLERARIGDGHGSRR